MYFIISKTLLISNSCFKFVMPCFAPCNVVNSDCILKELDTFSFRHSQTQLRFFPQVPVVILRLIQTENGSLTRSTFSLVLRRISGVTKASDCLTPKLARSGVKQAQFGARSHRHVSVSTHDIRELMT